MCLFVYLRILKSSTVEKPPLQKIIVRAFAELAASVDSNFAQSECWHCKAPQSLVQEI